MKKPVSLDALIILLKTIAEISRLRILALLCQDDLTISDFIFILGQSQSHVSRHLHLLYEAGVIACYQKREQTYFKFCSSCFGRDIVMAALSALPKHDVMFACDLERLVDVKKQRQTIGRQYFLKKTAQWEALQLSYIANPIVENALLEIIGDKPFEAMMAIGTDTGSLLKLFSGLYRRAVEVALDDDILHLSVGDTTFDLVILHWVLHYLENPKMALNEVARVLRPQGRLLIVDFVCGKVEASYSYHAHRYLRLSDSQIEQWLENAGLILEQTVCLAPMENEKKEGLVVKLWLARDPRLLVDDLKDKKVQFA
ncbi:ArsR/SmtB family transcription factor [Bartonella vinsonii]|uniref:Ubiquinone/menaquinone biosynthesis methyltransferase n=1 Tax=Bartonella vinsonii TaxID=33047 RepID=A0A448V786_BARVI|nr:methyltransferase domain-containing protein [Bartonella vinsonii]VEJ45636.1 ubiquinone/menaquinone biosynthesis methyltransferase [Bartonella vinsonii]